MEQALKAIQTLISVIENKLDTEQMSMREAAKLLKQLDNIVIQLKNINKSPFPEGSRNEGYIIKGNKY